MKICDLWMKDEDSTIPWELLTSLNIGLEIWTARFWAVQLMLDCKVYQWNRNIFFVGATLKNLVAFRESLAMLHSVFNLARQKTAGLSVHGVIYMGNCSIEAGIRRLVPVEVSGYPVVTPPKAAREPSDLKRGLPLFHNLVYWLGFVGRKSPRPTFYHFAGHFWYSIRSFNTVDGSEIPNNHLGCKKPVVNNEMFTISTGF